MEVLIWLMTRSLASIMLIHLKTVISERCPIESRGFPSPPPEFPDFMDAFRITISRIGIERLWPQDQDSSALLSCPSSVNWSSFNSRLCGDDPFDLDGFCRRTVAVTSDSIFTPTTDEDRNSNLPVTSLPDQSTGTVSLTHTKEDHERTVKLDNITEFLRPEVTSHSGFPVILSSVFSNSAIPVDPDLLQTSPENSSTSTAEALTHGGGGHVAIGLACGLTLLFICIIVLVIFISQDRTCGLRGMSQPMFKVFQRQRSDLQPFSSSQPSTPLQEIQSDPMSINNNVSELGTTGRSSVKRHADLQPSNDLELEMPGEKNVTS